MSTVEGVPVQLGNTNKVTGYTTISFNIGCTNKWSICPTANGVYFIDGYNKSLYLFATQGAPVNIGVTYGFDQWFKDNVTLTSWTP
jgi:hypothetical protein